MSITIHEVTVAPMLRHLEALSKILAKAEAHPDAASFAEARLYPDMFPLARQVQIASDNAKGISRVAGQEPPAFEDTETTLPALRERIAKTVAFLKTIDEKALNEGADRRFTTTFRGKEDHHVGREFITGRTLPNFFFHVTTAYAILRHKGVEIGKADYLGQV